MLGEFAPAFASATLPPAALPDRPIESIVVVDPGPTTGVAVLVPTPGHPSASISVRDFHRSELERWLSWVPQGALDDTLLLIERAPSGAANPASIASLVAGTLAPLARATVFVAPGEWKPWIRGNGIPLAFRQIARSPHQRDCLGMLWWWLHAGSRTPRRMGEERNGRADRTDYTSRADHE